MEPGFESEAAGCESENIVHYPLCYEPPFRYGRCRSHYIWSLITTNQVDQKFPIASSPIQTYADVSPE